MQNLSKSGANFGDDVRSGKGPTLGWLIIGHCIVQSRKLKVMKFNFIIDSNHTEKVVRIR